MLNNTLDSNSAINKILLLYCLDKVGKPISHNELLDLVTSIIDINYFDFQQFLVELIEDKFLISYNNEVAKIYEITEEGKNAVNLTIDTVPGILKLQVDSKFKENLDSIKDKYSVSAEYTPINEKEFMVRCKIVENNEILFDLQANAGSQEQSKSIVENWNNNAVDIYPKLLEILINDKKNNDIDEK